MNVGTGQHRLDHRFRPLQLLVILSFLALASIGPYLPSLGYEFVYDDHGQIVENQYLGNLSNIFDVITLKTLGSPHIVNGRRPLVLVSYFADTALWKNSPMGFRITNLVYHIGAVWMLFALVYRISLRAETVAHPLFPVVTALFFCLHPALTETVHSPAFRPDAMYVFFSLAYLHTAIFLPVCRTIRAVGGVLILMGVLLLSALGSKEAGIVAPALLVVMWVSFPRTRPRKNQAFLALVVSTMVVAMFALLSWPGGSLQAATGEWNGISLRFPDNVLTMPWIWVRYLRILLFPHPLILDRIVVPVTAFTDVRFGVGVCVLAVAFAAIPFQARRRPWVSMGIAFMLAFFFPVSNLVPLFNPMADRYLYGMTAGYAILLGRLLAFGGFRQTTAGRMRVAALIMICALFPAMTVIRLSDWRDDYLLWSKTLEQEPTSARALTWVGLELKARGLIQQAARMYERAEELNPHAVSATINRGILMGQLGNLEAAEQCFRQAIRRRPDKASGHWNLAVTLQKMGQLEEALMELNETLRLDPCQIPALRARIILLIDQKRFADALRDVETILGMDPHNRDAIAAWNYLQDIQ